MEAFVAGLLVGAFVGALAACAVMEVCKGLGKTPQRPIVVLPPVPPSVPQEPRQPRIPDARPIWRRQASQQAAPFEEEYNDGFRAW